jgi:hypothetical protein
MPFKPNYRYDRAERTRSKEARKKEKLEAQAARRQALREDTASPAEADDGAPTDTIGDHDGVERTGEKEE